MQAITICMQEGSSRLDHPSEESPPLRSQHAPGSLLRSRVVCFTTWAELRRAGSKWQRTQVCFRSYGCHDCPLHSSAGNDRLGIAMYRYGRTGIRTCIRHAFGTCSFRIHSGTRGNPCPILVIKSLSMDVIRRRQMWYSY